MKGTGSPDCCSFSDPRLQKRGHFYFGESGHFHFGTTRAMYIKSLQGGVEAEGVGVSVDDEEPTLALRDRVKPSQDLTFAPPLPKGDFQRSLQSSGEHEACFGSIHRAAASCR
jgi:hypothetical protein